MSSSESRTSDRARPSWTAVGLRQVTAPACVALLIIVAIGVVPTLPGKSPALIAGAALALAVAGVGVVVLLLGRTGTGVPDAAALAAIGLAGALLGGLLPSTPGFVLVYLALAGLGMSLAPVPAIASGVAVLAAMDLALGLSGEVSVSVAVAAVAAQNIGAAFVFSVAAFTRLSRIEREQARTAQLRAEDLLAQLRISQAAEAEAAALTERARLAREIHDILAHALSGLVLALDTMELLGKRAATDPRALDQLLEQVSRGQRIARDGLADTKRAIDALRGDDLPGPALLSRLVEKTCATTGIAAHVAVCGTERALAPEVGLALYRTAQEALTNTAKYAGQQARVELSLTYEIDAVELVVHDSRSDDAPGAVAAPTFGGYGLAGMRERAELLGGSLTAGPTDLGFAVRLRLPAADGTPPRTTAPGTAP